MDKFIVSKGPAKKKRKTEEGDAKEVEDGQPKEETITTTTITSTTSTISTDSNSKKIDSSKSNEDSVLQYLSEKSWTDKLKNETNCDYFKKILKFLDGEYKKGAKIFPPKNEIFSAFNLTPFDQVKCVIIGQDPYHDDGQAHGLCFSVKKGVAVPPSLKNIYKELSIDIEGFKVPSHGFLEHWARSGVLLLNATLTVEAHKANSHQSIGWQTFTDDVIKIINREKKNVVFLLWGGFAQKKGKVVDRKKHLVLEAAHPSPLGQGKFFGCKHFSKTNNYLKENGLPEIDWTIPQ